MAWVITSGGKKPEAIEAKAPSTGMEENNAEKEYTNEENPLQWATRNLATGALKAAEFPVGAIGSVTQALRGVAPGLMENVGQAPTLQDFEEKYNPKIAKALGLGEGYFKAHGERGGWKKPIEEILHSTASDLPIALATGGGTLGMKALTSLSGTTGAKIAEELGANPIVQAIAGFAAGRVPRWLKAGLSPKELMFHAEKEKVLSYDKEKAWRVKNGEPTYHSPELVKDSELIERAYDKARPSVKKTLGRDVEFFHKKVKGGKLTIGDAKDLKQVVGDAAYDRNIAPDAQKIFAATHKSLKDFLNKVADANPAWGNEFRKAEALHGAIEEAKKIGTVEKTGIFKRLSGATKSLFHLNFGSALNQIKMTPKDIKNREIIEKLVEKSPYIQQYMKDLKRSVFLGDNKASLSLLVKLNKAVEDEGIEVPEESKWTIKSRDVG